MQSAPWKEYSSAMEYSGSWLEPWAIHLLICYLWERTTVLPDILSHQLFSGPGGLRGKWETKGKTKAWAEWPKTPATASFSSSSISYQLACSTIIWPHDPRLPATLPALQKTSYKPLRSSVPLQAGPSGHYSPATSSYLDMGQSGNMLGDLEQPPPPPH